MLSVVLISQFNIGFAYSEKVKLADAADAAAYAQGIATARPLNFTAYTNRAMAANHLAVGHITSYLSWIRYLNNTWTNNPAYFNDVDDCPFFLAFLPACPVRNADWPGYVYTEGLAGLGVNIDVNGAPIGAGMRANFLNGSPLLGSPDFATHEANVIASLNNIAANNPAIFAAQQDAFNNALINNLTIALGVAQSYDPAIRINGCATPLCPNQTNDIATVRNLAVNLGQLDNAGILDAADQDLVSFLDSLEGQNGNPPQNDAVVLNFAEGGAAAAAEIRNFTLNNFINAHPSANWINNRNWNNNAVAPCGPANVDPNPTGCRQKFGATVATVVNVNGIDRDHWLASDNTVNLADGGAFAGAADTAQLLPNYNPFPGGFSLPDAFNGGPGPQQSELQFGVLAAKDLASVNQAIDGPAQGRKQLLLPILEEADEEIFTTAPRLLSAYALVRVFYNRPQGLGVNNFFAAIPANETEFANLYNPFWQARLSDNIRVIDQ